MKKCSICEQTKSETEFYKNSRAVDGLQKHCKSCHSAMAARWIENNREKKRETNRKAMAAFRERHPEKVKALNTKYRALHGDKYRQAARERERKKKLLIIERYGGQCACCGESDYRFLCIDHKNNDGYEHRKVKRVNIYDFIVANNFPDTFQVLCFNCNCARALYGGKEKICPHQLSREVID
jgi:hypothetical protein